MKGNFYVRPKELETMVCGLKTAGFTLDQLNTITYYINYIIGCCNSDRTAIEEAISYMKKWMEEKE